MAEQTQSSPAESSKSPERFFAYAPLPGFQGRIALGTTALDASKAVAITKEALGADQKAVNALVAKASSLERAKQCGSEKPYDAQMEEWKTHFTSSVTAKKEFFTTKPQGQEYAAIFKKLQIDVVNFTDATAQEVYGRYFGNTDHDSNIELFVDDVVKTIADVNDAKSIDSTLKAARWLSGMFGENSADIVSQMIHAKIKIAKNADEFVAETSKPAQPDKLETRSKELLTFLSEAGATQLQAETEDEPAIAGSPTQPHLEPQGVKKIIVATAPGADDRTALTQIAAVNEPAKAPAEATSKAPDVLDPNKDVLEQIAEKIKKEGSFTGTFTPEEMQRIGTSLLGNVIPDLFVKSKKVDKAKMDPLSVKLGATDGSIDTHINVTAKVVVRGNIDVHLGVKNGPDGNIMLSDDATIDSKTELINSGLGDLRKLIQPYLNKPFSELKPLLLPLINKQLGEKGAEITDITLRIKNGKLFVDITGPKTESEVKPAVANPPASAEGEANSVLPVDEEAKKIAPNHTPLVKRATNFVTTHLPRRSPQTVATPAVPQVTVTVPSTLPVPPAAGAPVKGPSKASQFITNTRDKVENSRVVKGAQSGMHEVAQQAPIVARKIINGTKTRVEQTLHKKETPPTLPVPPKGPSKALQFITDTRAKVENSRVVKGAQSGIHEVAQQAPVVAKKIATGAQTRLTQVRQQAPGVAKSVIEGTRTRVEQTLRRKESQPTPLSSIKESGSIEIEGVDTKEFAEIDSKGKLVANENAHVSTIDNKGLVLLYDDSRGSIAVNEKDGNFNCGDGAVGVVRINSGTITAIGHSNTTVYDHRDGDIHLYQNANTYIDSQENGWIVPHNEGLHVVTPHNTEIAFHTAQDFNVDVAEVSKKAHFKLPKGVQSLSSFVSRGKLDEKAVQKAGGTVDTKNGTVTFIAENENKDRVTTTFSLTQATNEKGLKEPVLALTNMEEIAANDFGAVINKIDQTLNTPPPAPKAPVTHRRIGGTRNQRIAAAVAGLAAAATLSTSQLPNSDASTQIITPIATAVTAEAAAHLQQATQTPTLTFEATTATPTPTKLATVTPTPPSVDTPIITPTVNNSPSPTISPIIIPSATSLPTNVPTAPPSPTINNTRPVSPTNAPTRVPPTQTSPAPTISATIPPATPPPIQPTIAISSPEVQQAPSEVIVKKPEINTVTEYLLQDTMNRVREQRAQRLATDPSFKERVSTELLNKNTINILFVGVDSSRGRGGEQGNHSTRGNADIIMLISVDPATLRTTAFSIPRDTFSPAALQIMNIPRINGLGWKNDPPNLSENDLVKEIERVTGAPVDGRETVNLDFMTGSEFGSEPVPSFLDFLFPNGMDVNNPSEIFDNQYPTADYGYKTVHFAQGPIHLKNAEEIVEYSRVRHGANNSDFARANRQRQVLFEALKSRGLDVAKMFLANDITFMNDLSASLATQARLGNYTEDGGISLIQMVNEMAQRVQGLSLPQKAELLKTMIDIATSKGTTFQDLGLSRENGLVRNIDANAGETLGRTDMQYVLVAKGSTVKDNQTTPLGNNIHYWTTIRAEFAKMIAKLK